MRLLIVAFLLAISYAQTVPRRTRSHVPSAVKVPRRGDRIRRWAQSIGADVNLPCESHADCANNGDDVFCWIDECHPCDECWFCTDGVDGTCGPCQHTDGYPTQEAGPCPDIIEGCQDAGITPTTPLSFESATLELANLDCKASSIEECAIIYGEVGRVDGKSVKLKVTMAPGYEGTYKCSSGSHPDSPNVGEPRCTDNLWGNVAAIQVAHSDDPQKLRFQLVDEDGDIVPFNAMLMTFIDMDGSEENLEVVYFHEATAVLAWDENPWIEIEELSFSYDNSLAGTGEFRARNDHDRTIGLRTSGGSHQVDNPTSLQEFLNNSDMQHVAAQGFWFRFEEEDPLEYFDVSLYTEGAGRTLQFFGYASGFIQDDCQTCGDENLVDRFGDPFSIDDCPYGVKPGYQNAQCNDGVINNCNEHFCCITEIHTTSSAHGDPIIWTFSDECYDLNKDGSYLASSHPQFNHDVYISVYNDFMRDIQVIDQKSGKVMLAINSLGEVVKDGFPYILTDEIKDCPEGKIGTHKNECTGTYREWSFDAQHFRYYVFQLRHDYLDSALADGELGWHLDIQPKPFKSFTKKGVMEAYTGLYFENPLPEELEYCEGGKDNSRWEHIDGVKTEL